MYIVDSVFIFNENPNEYNLEKLTMIQLKYVE